MWHAILHVIGLDDGSGGWYLFWSGIGSDLAYLGIFAVLYRRLNCHQDGCRRIGTHRVEGTPFVTCRKHHPGIPGGRVTAERIRSAHHAHLHRPRDR